MTDTLPTASRVQVIHVEPLWNFSMAIHVTAPDDATPQPLLSDLRVFFHRAGEVLAAVDPWSDLARWRRGDVAIDDCDPMLSEVIDAASEACVLSHGHFDPWWRDGAPDPTGLVKGWIVERAVTMARERGITDLMLKAGGDSGAVGVRADGQPWRVGIECPWQSDALLDVIEGTDVRVATSGLHRRGAHIYRGGQPVTDLLSVTVCGPDLMLADALSTAAFSCGKGAGAFLATLSDEWSFLIVDRNHDVVVSRNWRGATSHHCCRHQ